MAALPALTACGGGGGGRGAVAGATSALPVAAGDANVVTLSAPGAEPAKPSLEARPSAQSAARFLTQASFGARSVEEIEALRSEGFEHWLWAQFAAPTLLRRVIWMPRKAARLTIRPLRK